jgi:phosphoribosylformylglycinamidine synthase subunit PurS
VTEVRQGKRFELEVADTSAATIAEIEKLAETFLANTVIENFVVRIEA